MPATQWPHETSESGPHAALAAALDAASEDVKALGKLKTTLFEAAPGDCDGDLLLFSATSASRVRCGSPAPATAAAFAPFLRRLLSPDAEPLLPTKGSAAMAHLFVCAHSKRDKRCGACGPALLPLLKQAGGGSVVVRACSHIGGHAYAGNVLAFTRGADAAAPPTAPVRGDWYGYVTPDAVPRLVADVVAGRRGEARLFRGAMGMSKEEAVAAAAQAAETEAAAVAAGAPAAGTCTTC